MYPSIIRYLLYVSLLLIIGCSSNQVQDTTSTPANTSANAVVFDPTTNDIPMPNVLASAMATDPLTAYSAPSTGKMVAKTAGPRPANTPMNPAEALAYVNIYEMGVTSAVDGVNAPIYIHFNSALDPATVTSANIKVFQTSTSDTDGTENHALSFADITGMFTIKYTAGGKDLFLFPNFPLQPGTKYMYVVTSRVKDAATGKSVANSFYFNALKSLFPLVGPLAQLEQVRGDKMNGAAILFRGYYNVMNDLITNATTTTIASRDDIALMGRFITTGAGYVSKDGTGSTASMMPVESALRAFAGGTNLAALGGLSGKTWTNSTTVTATFDRGGVNPLPDAYWTGVMGAATAAPTNVNKVVTGTINSAQLSIDPVVKKANSSTIDLTGITLGGMPAYNPAAGVVQTFRDGTGALTGYYHTTSTVPFVLITPTPALSTGKVVIFQHGITGQKEQVIAVAKALTDSGYTVVAIDLPLHGGLAVPTHTTGAVWGQDFMAVGAPLATRSNVQQAAFNLHRLEITMRTGGFAPVAGAAGAGLASDIKYVSLSLGSIVGAYYLAGNTTLSTTGFPYTQTTLNSDMKGFLSVPGGRLAYLIQNSPAFSPSVNAGLLAQANIAAGSPTYNQFFQATQSIVDPVDPATMTTPLAAGLPSRLSGRIAIQEAVGDQVIPNDNARYFGNALGGREVLGAAANGIAPNFKQLGYRGAATPRIPSSFMYTLTGGALAAKVGLAAQSSVGAATPSEGYFQFDQTGINHGFLIDPTASAANTQYAQSQMVQYLLFGGIVDPTPSGVTKQTVAEQAPALRYDVSLPPVLKIFGY